MLRNVKVTRDSYIVMKSESSNAALEKVNKQAIKGWKEDGKSGNGWPLLSVESGLPVFAWIWDR